MEPFNINNVIDAYKIDVDDLSKVLYPDAKYPRKALDRVLRNETSLSVTQLERLASHLGIMLTELISVSPNTWSGSTEDRCLIMSKGEYKVKLNYNNIYLSVYKNTEMIYRSISDIPSMTIPDFINYINNIIKNYENGSN